MTALVAAGCARTAAVTSQGDVGPQTLPNASAIPTGTTLQTRLNETLGTKESRVGDKFTATVTTPVNAQNGDVVVPEGTTVYGEVTGLHASEHVGDQAAISVNFDSLSIDNQNYPFEAKVTATNLKTQGDTKNQTLEKAGIGAAAGAALGAILSGGNLGKTVLGGLLGAAGGTAISLGAGEVQAVLPSGTEMTIQSTQQVALSQ